MYFIYFLNKFFPRWHSLGYLSKLFPAHSCRDSSVGGHWEPAGFQCPQTSSNVQSKVGGSKSAQVLKSPTSSNIHYLYMFLFFSLQQCTNIVHFRGWVILEP